MRYYQPLEFKIKDNSFNKTIEVPSSKSYSNRLLILGSICEEPFIIKNISDSTDVLNLIDCLKKIGLKIEINNDELVIVNSFPECELFGPPIELLTGDGGTTNRFLIALLSRGRRSYNLKPSGRIKQRPIEPLINCLEKMGVLLNYSSDSWINIQGPARDSDKIIVDSRKSSQFVSSISLAFANTDMNIIHDNLHFSSGYFKITKTLIDYYKKGKRIFEVPIDFSSLSYPAALAATSGKLLVSNYSKIDNLQPDSIFLSILQEMGVKCSVSSLGLLIEKASYLVAIERDCSEFPDLVPTLVYLCSFCDGISKLSGLEVLTYKESDRVKALLDILTVYDISHRFDASNYCLYINGSSNSIKYVDSYHNLKDHRIIMTAYLFMRTLGGGTIDGVEHIKKSFPNFFHLME